MIRALEFVVSVFVYLIGEFFRWTAWVFMRICGWSAYLGAGCIAIWSACKAFNRCECNE